MSDTAITLKQINIWAERAGAVSTWIEQADVTPEHGSIFALDNEQLQDTPSGYKASDFAAMPLLMSGDPCRSLSQLLIPVSTRSARPRIATTYALTRVVTESASRSLWLTTPAAQRDRIGRTLVMHARNLNYFEHYESHRKHLVDTPDIKPDNQDTSYNDHMKELRERARKSRELAAPFQPKERLTESRILDETSTWIEENPPQHEIVDITNHLTLRCYAITSSFIHGYPWATNILLPRENEEPEKIALEIVKDSLAVAVTLTECATSLWEAHRRSLGNEARGTCPDYLLPTVIAYQRLHTPAG